MGWLAGERDRLDRFRQGDRQTLGEVYAHYAPEIGRLLGHGFTFQSGDERFRFSGFSSPFDLDDVLQETFIRALSEPARRAYDGLRPYRNYLMSIARNLVIDRHRKSNRRDRCFARIESEEEQKSPESTALETELREIVRHFKGGLDEDERTLFEMRFEQGATRQAVQAATGLSAMKVRTREKRIRAQLYDFLRTRGYGPAEAAALTLFILLTAAGMVT